MRSSRIFYFLSSCLLTASALAEYRVYQYLIKSKNLTVMINDTPAQIVRSTLNPVAYLSYFGGAELIDLTLQRTWMCPGYTGRQDYCRHPSERISHE